MVEVLRLYRCPVLPRTCRSVGAAYKPCVVRGRNHHGNVRIGASVGSNTDKFLGGFHVGYEHNFALRKGWFLYVQAKCDLLVPDRKDLFREGIVVGFKIPTLKHSSR